MLDSTYLQLIYFVLFITSGFASDLTNQVLQLVDSQLDIGNSKIRNYEYLGIQVEQKVKNAVSRIRQPQLTNAPSRLITLMDKKIDTFSHQKINRVEFAPLQEYVENKENNRDELLHDMILTRNDFQSYIENEQMYYASLQNFDERCDFENKFESNIQSIADSYESVGQLIRQVVQLKLDNVDNEEANKNSELNNIKSMAQILLSDLNKNLTAELKHFQTEVVEEIKNVTRCGMDLQSEVRQMNVNLNDYTSKTMTIWNEKIAEIKMKDEELKTLNNIVQISQLNGDESREVPEEIPPLFESRKKKQVKLISSVNELGEAMNILYEQQRESKNTDSFTRTQFLNEKLVMVDKWLIQYK